MSPKPMVDQLSPTMKAALVHLAKSERPMRVGWKNTPYIIASGTAEGLTRRGLARSDGLLLSGTFTLLPTESGRALANGIMADEADRLGPGPTL